MYLNEGVAHTRLYQKKKRRLQKIIKRCRTHFLEIKQIGTHFVSMKLMKELFLLDVDKRAISKLDIKCLCKTSTQYSDISKEFALTYCLLFVRFSH
ncbi:hypothetical protein AAZX31_01G043300 [Glycine max]